jgi:hypothetical protein
MHITGIDANSRVLEAARRFCGDRKDVEFKNLDAMTLLDESTCPFPPRCFDYVHAGMFIHHLDDRTVPRMLGAMNRLARAGIVWNDLIRSRRGYAISWLATIGLSIRHDCLASLRAGFREREAISLASRSGLSFTRWREKYFYQRFSISGEKRGAWPPRGGDAAQRTPLPASAAGGP